MSSVSRIVSPITFCCLVLGNSALAEDTVTSPEVAPETSSESTSTPESALPKYVVHVGLDAGVALRQVSSATNTPAASFTPVMLVDIASKGEITSLKGATIEKCSSTPMSNARLKKFVQEMDHALAYYELEKADSLFQSARTGLSCVRDTLDPDIVSRLYFLEGVLRYSNDQADLSREAYVNAVRFNPAIHWDDNFAPDSKELFDQALQEFSSVQEKSAQFYPVNSIGAVWINGVPCVQGETPQLYVGDNIIQVFGAQIDTVKIHVDANTDVVELVFPSMIVPETYAWASDVEQQPELAKLLQGMLTKGQEVYFYQNAQIFFHVVGTPEWTVLEPSWTASVLTSDTTEKIGKSMFWVGVAIATGGGALAGVKALDAKSIWEQGNTASTYDVYLSTQGNYEDVSKQYTNSLVVSGVGVGIAGIGYLLQR